MFKSTFWIVVSLIVGISALAVTLFDRYETVTAKVDVVEPSPLPTVGSGPSPTTEASVSAKPTAKPSAALKKIILVTPTETEKPE